MGRRCWLGQDLEAKGPLLLLPWFRVPEELVNSQALLQQPEAKWAQGQ